MADALWLARHGNRQDFADPDWHKTAERPHDPGLTPDGIEQARKLGRRLTGEGIQHILASPFLRAAETAHHVAEALDLPFCLEPGFGEWMNPGWFAERPVLLSSEALAERFPRIDLSYSPRFELPYPETEEAAFRRAEDTVRALADACDGPILLVGHGASVTGAACGLAGDAEIECALCSLTKLVRQEQEWKMTLSGDVAHLEHAEGADRFH